MMMSRSVHFVGIGGIGMSALARYFKNQKWAVSGSDRIDSDICRALRKEGVAVKIGHTKGNVRANLDLLVYNRAIPDDNPELLAARRLKVNTLPYATVLGDLTKHYATIAISGSHGKSTTTALAGLMLMQGGLDPTILIGTNLRELGGKNIRIGKGPYLALEADDFGGAFLHYSPAIAIVTNIDREHLDYYKSFSNLKRAFLEFLGNTRRGGALILNRDDKVLFSLKTRIAAIAKKNGVGVVWYSLRGPGAKKIRRAITIPGEHNVSNASAVHQLGKILKVPEAKVLRAIGSYRGAWRRMEYRGTLGGAKKGAPVYDDYAHHPTEIRATLAAFRQKYPKKKIVCVFQPHQMKRLAALFKEFTAAFDGADETVLLPIYKVAGRDEKPGKYDSEKLAKAIARRRPKKFVAYLAEPNHLRRALLALPRSLSDKVIVMMGAGDIVDYTPSLLS